MLILTIRTDKPEAEAGLYNGNQQLAYYKWPAHRKLAETIHVSINELLSAQERGLHDIEGIITFKGPGSFTGLRIGLSVANTLAYTCNIPIVSAAGDDWIKLGLARLQDGENDRIALPEYGSPPHITLPRK
jgi:tRNA threonylcarbamoyladenosine biosynthesis protein TsaB